jgi:hypothetical protein
MDIPTGRFDYQKLQKYCQWGTLTSLWCQLQSTCAGVTLKIGPCWKMTLWSFFNIKYWPWSKFNVIFWSKVVIEKWSTLNFGRYEGHFLTTARTSDRVTSQH